MFTKAQNFESSWTVNPIFLPKLALKQQLYDTNIKDIQYFNLGHKMQTKL